MYPPTYQVLNGGNDSDGAKPANFLLSQKKRKLLSTFLAFAVVSYILWWSLSKLSRVHFQFPERRPCHRNLSSVTLPSHYTLPSGDEIPSIALGVWKASRDQVGEAVKAALNAGYRHIDGAWIYGNEAEVGQALTESTVPRDQIWLTSKLWNSFHAPEDIENTLDDTLSKLRTDYLDLYIIHWPIASYPDRGGYNKELTANPYPTWRKLEDMVTKGKVRNIGLSNFNIPRLVLSLSDFSPTSKELLLPGRIQNLTANPLRIKPAVNQVELNFWNPQPELLKWSKENGLLLEAYSPLGSDKQVGASLSVPEVKAIANELGITPAQVIISWHIQRGTVVLPKSVDRSHIQENLHVVALPDDLFKKLENAATSHKPERVVNPSKEWELGFDIFDDYPAA